MDLHENPLIWPKRVFVILTPPRYRLSALWVLIYSRRVGLRPHLREPARYVECHETTSVVWRVGWLWHSDRILKTLCHDLDPDPESGYNTGVRQSYDFHCFSINGIQIQLMWWKRGQKLERPNFTFEEHHFVFLTLSDKIQFESGFRTNQEMNQVLS